MIALFYNIAILHHQYEIRITDGGKPVGNDKAGSAFHQMIHSLLDLLFRPGIHGAGCFVQNHDFIVRQNSAGNGEKLLLALGPVSYTHLRAHETRHDLVCRLLLEKKNL